MGEPQTGCVITTWFYEIHVRNEQTAWCRLLWNNEGRVIILSDYGHWSYWWGHRGEGVSVPLFISKLDQEYMGKKMLGENLREYDHAATVAHIRKTILEHRRFQWLCKDDARDEWGLVADLDTGDIDFSQWGSRTTLNDPYEYHRDDICSHWRHFWERLWHPLVLPVLQEHVTQCLAAKTSR